MFHFIGFVLKFNSSLLFQRAYFLLNAAAFAMAILDITARTSCIVCYHATHAGATFHMPTGN
jgi:hypothetical protein